MTANTDQTRDNAREILHRIWPDLDRTDPATLAEAARAFSDFLAGLDFGPYVGALAHRANTDAAVVYWLAAEATGAQVRTFDDLHELAAATTDRIKAGRAALYARWQFPGSASAARIAAGPAALRELLAATEEGTR